MRRTAPLVLSGVLIALTGSTGTMQSPANPYARAAKQPVDNLMLSNSIRAAVIGFGRTLANEAAPFGVTVNNLLPGFTRTERMVELSEVTAHK